MIMKSSLVILLLSLAACAQSPKTKKPNQTPTIHAHIQSFDQVEENIKSLVSVHGENGVLVVLDIDNTLLTSDVDLGGDVWYQWQRGKLEVKPTPEQKVSCLFEDAIGLLYELGPMDLTEASVPDLVSQWQQQGLTVFALTSRSPKYRSATERELAAHDLDFTVSALTDGLGELPVYDGDLERPYSYINGVMMTTGMDKGQMLQFILNKTGKHYPAIVFVDDSEKNITNINQAYLDSNTEMHLFHYTRIEDQRIKAQGTVLTQTQADQMAQAWDDINALLNRVFPERAARQDVGCVAGE